MFGFGTLVLCVSLALCLGDDCQSEECASEVLNAVEFLQVQHVLKNAAPVGMESPEEMAAQLKEEAKNATVPLTDKAMLSKLKETSAPEQELLGLEGAERLILTSPGVSSTNELGVSQRRKGQSLSNDTVMLTQDKKYCAMNSCSSDWVYKTQACEDGQELDCWNSGDNYKCCAKKHCEMNSCSSGWVYKSEPVEGGKQVDCWNSGDNYKCLENKHCEMNSCSSGWVYKTEPVEDGKQLDCWNSGDNYKCLSTKYCAMNSCSSGWVYKTEACEDGKQLDCWNSGNNYKCCA